MDWAKLKMNIKWSYTIELIPYSDGDQGFKVPESRIVETGDEMWAGLKVVVAYITEDAK